MSIRRTTIITIVLAAFLIGLGLARIRMTMNVGLLVPIGVLEFIVHKRKSLVFTISLIVIAVLFGWWRGTVYMQKLVQYDRLYGHNVVFEGTAAEDAVYARQSQLSFTITSPKVIAPNKQNLTGQVLVGGFGEHMVYRGDRVRVSGKLNSSKGSKQARISFATISTVQHNNSELENIRHKFVAGMQTALPEPLASFALGLLIGQRNTLPVGVTTVLVVVGLTHIVAVSGYNLTILTDSSKRLVSSRSRYQTIVVSLGLVAIFVLLVGFSASIVRAALVSVLGITAWYFGRNIRPILLILLVAALTAGINPLFLWGDAGWYLSFLAFFGVLIMAPLTASLIGRGPKKPGILVTLIAETVCAQIMTVPIVLFMFGQASTIALPANLLVVPLVPVAMFLSLIAGVAGMLTPTISGVVAWPARALLTYMLDIATILSHIPHVVITRTISAGEMIMMYVLIALLGTSLWFKVRPKYGIITDEIEE